MADIKAGVVCVTKFCRAGSKEFQAYIDYIDREEAARTEHNNEYNLYADYMGNPEKTTGLFTSEKNNLNPEEKKLLKEQFSKAQENGSLMWQTVLSFDNRWLAEQGIYDLKTQMVDEKKIYEATRKAVSKMLKSERLENAVWSAAIHFNTDNIHVHIATVEPEPMRQKKEYIQYHDVDKDGVKIKEPILDPQGQPMKREEYVGRFKQKSIDACKSVVANELLNDRENNLKINRIIRESIVKQKQKSSLINDRELKEEFLRLYHKLPDVKRNLWNYNNNVMKARREDIDRLSELYLQRYHSKEYQELKNLLKVQELKYQQSYGKNEKSYQETKLLDLYTRLGNQILKEMRAHDKYLREQGEVQPYGEHDIEAVEQLFPEEEEKNVLPDNNDLQGEVAWSKEYKKARRLIYRKPPEYKKALEILRGEKNNALALYEIGNCYQYGRGVEINREEADKFYNKALDIFKNTYEALDQEASGEQFLLSYLPYRIGKQYYYGQGTEIDFEEARIWFEGASDAGNQYAQYALGNVYYNGNGVEKDFECAMEYYQKAALQSNPYAEYKLAKMYEIGEGTEKDSRFAENYYKRAYWHFEEMLNEDSDDHLLYRLAMMSLNGQGTEINKVKGQEYLEQAAESGNINAKYQLAKFKIETGDVKEIKDAILLLKEAADKGKNQMAQYVLGKIFTDGEKYQIETDMRTGIHYLELAVKQENKYAAYSLGKIYADVNGEYFSKEKAVFYLQKSDLKENPYAQYTLGKLYLELGTDSEKEKGIFYLEQAAQKEFEPAQYKLGRFYTDVTNPKHDFEKGLYYLEQSAQKNQYAQLALGMLYVKGEGCKRDLKQAKYWLEKSAEQGNEYAENMLKNIEMLKGRSDTYHLRREQIRQGRILDSTLRSLKKSLNDEYEKKMNEREHDRLVEQEEL